MPLNLGKIQILPYITWQPAVVEENRYLTLRSDSTQTRGLLETEEPMIGERMARLYNTEHEALEVDYNPGKSTHTGSR
jgi:hypothetical protein